MNRNFSPPETPWKGDLYRTLAQNFPNGAVLLFDRDLRYILADGTGLPDVGLASEMIEGRTIWEVFSPDICTLLEPRYRAALAGEASNFEVAYAGRIFQVHTLPIHDGQGGISFGMVMTQDITPQKRAEERLRSSQQRYEKLVNTIDGIVWEGDANTFQYYFVSEQAERILGYPVERWVTEPTFWSDHIHPDDRDWAVNFCSMSTAEKKDHVFEYRMVAADGRVVWLQDIVTVVVEDGEPAALRGVMLDITEKKRIEADLYEREQQYRSIFESVNDGLFINTLDQGELVDFNPAAARMHGYTEEEFRRIQPADFIHPDSHEIFSEYLETVRAGRIFRGRARDVRKDGEEFYVEVLGTALTYKGEPHTLAVVRDIDEEVKSLQLLEQRVEERTRELKTLLDVSRNVASELDLDQLMHFTIDQLKSIVDFTALRLWMREDEDTFVLREYKGPVLGKNGAQRWKQPPHHRKILDLITLQKPVIIPDVHADTPEARIWREATMDLQGRVPAFISSWMVVPLIVKNKVIGVLSFNHEEPNFYTHRSAELALALANHAAVAIENARLYQSSSELAALRERQKLARELHDSVSQALYGISLGARTARMSVEGGDYDGEKLVEALDFVLTLADAGLAEMRALIFELRPESLETEGLVIALTKQSDAFKARHQLQIETSFCPEPELSLENKVTIYRIAQEALHNIVKHARATKVTLELHSGEKQVTLEITDDGIGFDPLREYPGHLGLRSMHERAERVGGDFSLASKPGEGTKVSIRIPLN